MKKTIVARHYAGSEKTCKEFVEKVDITSKSEDLNRFLKEEDAKFFYRLSYSPELSVKCISEIDEIKANIQGEYKSLIKRPDSTEMESIIESLFGAGEVPVTEMAILGDLDQYDFTSPDALVALDDLFKNVSEKGYLMGIGARNCEVILNPNKKASDIRIIHELFNSIVVKPDLLYDPRKVKYKTTKGYNELGENSSGLYVVNYKHEESENLKSSVLSHFSDYFVSDFAVDYYTSIKAAQIGKVCTGYVHAYENKFHTKPDENVVRNVGERIASATKKIARTDVGKLYRDTVLDKSSAGKISEHYDKDSVLYVQNILREVLELNKQ